MAVVRWEQFTGIAPKAGPRRLPLGAALVAENVKFESGRLLPAVGYEVTEAVAGGTLAFHKFKDYWLTSAGEAIYERSPVRQDVHERIYSVDTLYPYPVYATISTGYAGYNSAVDTATNPRMPSVLYRLGIGAPETAPSVTLGTAPTPPAGTTPVSIATNYVYTIVTEFGEESAPSDPSPVVNYVDGQDRNVSIPATTQSNVALGTAARKRIYRTASGATTTEFLFVDEVAYSQTTYTDQKADAELGEIILTENHYPPPNDDVSLHPSGPLKSLVRHPQGFFAGHTGKTVCFSEPYLPHAWNPDNQLTTSHDIVAMASGPAGIVIGTKFKPYLCVGNTPEAMDLYPLEAEYACASKDSMVEMAGSVLYASYDGIVAVSGNNVTLLTDNLFNRKQWEEYNPVSIRAFAFENRYIGFYSNDSGSGGFVLDPKANAFYELGYYATAGHLSEDDDALYLLVDGDIVKFEAGTDLSYNWQSGEIRLHDYIMFGWARVEAEGSVTFKIKVDGVDFYTKVVTDERPFAIPAGMRGDAFTIELTGSSTVESVSISDAIEEIEP